MGSVNGTFSTFLDVVLAVLYMGLFGCGWRALTKRGSAPAAMEAGLRSFESEPDKCECDSRDHDKIDELLPVG